MWSPTKKYKNIFKKVRNTIMHNSQHAQNWGQGDYNMQYIPELNGSQTPI